MTKKRDLRLVTFAAGIVVLAAAAMALTLVLRPVSPSVLLAALAILAMLSEVLCVEFASVSVSVAASLAATANILFGPAAGGIVAAMSTIPASLTVRDRPVLRGSFNLGQLALAGLAGGWAYVLAGGRPLFTQPLTTAETPRAIVPLILLAVFELLANTVLVGSFVSIRDGIRFGDVWKSLFSWGVPTNAALLVIAVAMAQVSASEGVVGLGLFVVPLVIARQFYERYLTLKKTYADTVRSLVAVIEAQDAYTRGHSERVAAYAMETARRLGFESDRVERIELAALLHDLGKVGISPSILSKGGPLSRDEYEIIKTHPEIAAHIIEEVPFLADLVPSISTHHERVDGTGYGKQLQGDEIPVEGKILAVADAFDAMTSSRPYRDAMTVAETVGELRRCSGGQFDALVVETFVEAIESEELSRTLPRVGRDEAI